MNKIQKKVASVAAAAGMLLQLGAPVFATTEIVITGNGAGSTNYATVSDVSSTTVTQSNNAMVVNNVQSGADTGGNTAEFNTGGPVVISTGDANSMVNIDNDLNSNAAYVDCCDAGDTTVKIDGNGAQSLNTVALNKVNAVVVDQDNYAYVENNVESEARTGDNSAGLNTGGDILILTGNASSDVAVSTTANSNVAVVASPYGSGYVPSASFEITGNGALSDNFINATLYKTTLLDQDNSAKIANNVRSKAKTGWNSEQFNVGGENVITTGDANAMTDVNNDVNFNYASIDCGCAYDITAKIAGNGADYYGYDNEYMYPYNYVGDNVINLTAGSTKAYGQDNLASLNNNLWDQNADTGDNYTGLNTGPAGVDPIIVTGNAYSASMVNNTGNVNTIGGSPLFDIPMFDADVTFNMSYFWAMFGMFS